VGCHEGRHEFGYWISRPHWGLGYATEAGEAFLAAARHSLRLKHLSAHHFLDTPASGRVLEKLGFRSTGLIASRYSAGRRGSAPAKLYTLCLGATAGTEELEMLADCNRQRVAA
jgi:RimJ/RimL family protein N-acetyltransferase